MTVQSRHILIVDDQPCEAALIAALSLSSRMVRVDHTRDGSRALAMCLRKRYDLVVTDPMLAGAAAITLTQALAASNCKPALVLISAASPRMMASFRLMAESLHLKVLAVLCKPVCSDDVASLLEALDAWIGQRQQAGNELDSMLTVTRDDLSQAIATRQIFPWFQPKVSTASRKIVAAEALVRWWHPELGLVPPSRFLHLIRAYGLEAALLRHVLRASIEAQRRWGAGRLPIAVSINLPTHLLERRSLPDELLELTLQEGGVAEDICFEVMESTMTRHVSDFYAGALRLRMNGFGLAQDDFGQGMSSMCNLLSTPFTEVKLDRSLVHGCMRSASLRDVVSAIIALSIKLGMNVVAEGVETEEEFATLERLGCAQVQGFLISPAVPSESLIELLG